MDKSGGSSVELLTPSQQLKLETEFTPSQIANFKKAFGVFDVNKDGRISTQEIFEVLHTMGNEVSPERQQKIREAVVLVDIDKSGDLDFPEFIQFMKIMDQHNKVEALEQGNAPAGPPADMTNRRERYFNCLPITFQEAEEGSRLRWIWRWIIWAFVLYNVVFAIFVTIISFIDFGFNLSQRPNGTYELLDDITNYIRKANCLNGLAIVLMMSDIKRIDAIFDVMYERGYRQNAFNLIRYLVLHAFVLNGLASGVFIYNIDGIKPEITPLVDRLAKVIPPAAQIVTTYIMLSPYLYFTWWKKPSTAKASLLIIIVDLFCLNIIRIFIHIVKMIALLFAFPLNFMLSIVLFSYRCCRCRRIDVDGENSLSSKLVHLLARLHC